MQTNPAAGRSFYTLDALRGVAALAVVAVHAANYLKPLGVAHGYLAVDLFFIISGCVIDHAYRARLGTGMKFGEFMRLRWVRLYPLYFAGLLIGTVVAAAGLILNPQTDWTFSLLAVVVIGALFFLPVPTGNAGDPAFPLNAPAWTLFFEIAVNMLYAALFRHISTRVAVVVAAIAGLVLLVAGLTHDTIDLGYTFDTFVFGIPRVCFGFFAGVAISRLNSGAAPRPRDGEVLAILLVGAIALCAKAGDLLPNGVWDIFCVLVLFPVLVVRACTVNPTGHLKIAATTLGVSSYAIYAVHVPLLGLLGAGTRILHVDLAAMSPYTGLIILAGLVVLAIGLDKYYDTPVRRWLSGAWPLSARARRQGASG